MQYEYLYIIQKSKTYTVVNIPLLSMVEERNRSVGYHSNFGSVPQLLSGCTASTIERAGIHKFKDALKHG